MVRAFYGCIRLFIHAQVASQQILFCKKTGKIPPYSPLFDACEHLCMCIRLLQINKSISFSIITVRAWFFNHLKQSNVWQHNASEKAFCNQTINTYLMKNILIGICFLFLCSCNKSSNELPPFAGADSTFVKPIILFDNRSDIVSATFYHYKSSLLDSVCVCFKNLSPDTLSNLHVAIEVSPSLSPAFDNSKIYLNRIFTLRPGDSSARYVVATDQNLPFVPAYYNVYVLGYDSSKGPGLGGIYGNRFSLFRNRAGQITEFPQLYGFVQVDGSALFRIKISDSVEYTIPNGRFQGQTYFSGYLMTRGQIVSYLSLDSAQSSRDSARFVFRLLKPLSDSTTNILIDAYKH